jgi:hypothetical protein
MPTPDDIIREDDGWTGWTNSGDAHIMQLRTTLVKPRAVGTASTSLVMKAGLNPDDS